MTLKLEIDFGIAYSWKLKVGFSSNWRILVYWSALSTICTLRKSWATDYWCYIAKLHAYIAYEKSIASEGLTNIV